MTSLSEPVGRVRYHNSILPSNLNTMPTPLRLPQRRDKLVRLVANLERGDSSVLAELESLLAEAGLIRTFEDAELKDLILVVKHHRPDLALVLLTHVRAEKERMSLGSCLAAIWSRMDINTAWRAISASSLPARERLELQSAMM